MITKAYKTILFPDSIHEDLIETLNAKLLNRRVTVTMVRENYYDTLISAQSDTMRSPVHIRKYEKPYEFAGAGYDGLIIPMSSVINIPLDGACPSSIELVKNFVNVRIAASTRIGRGATHFSINIHE